MENINETIQEYYDALNRLIQNKPINISKESKINKDTVALEAGRKRGSIKKSRDVFADLIQSIDDASNKHTLPIKEQKKKLDTLKSERNKYKKLYEEGLNRELMYIEQINELEKQLQKYNYANNIHP